MSLLGILEMISPAGFERFFDELVDLGGVTSAKPQLPADLLARYGLDMDPGSVPGLVEATRSSLSRSADLARAK